LSTLTRQLQKNQIPLYAK